MAPKLTQEQTEAIKAAMMADIGVVRLEGLPMEDGEGGRRLGKRTRGPPPIQANFPVAMNSKWLKAINDGKFNDDDAAQVKGMDSMADGHLARTRRQEEAGNVASGFIAANYSERNLPRDRNGNIPPRTNFKGQTRNQGHMLPLRHSGDGPIDMNAINADVRKTGSPKHMAPVGSSRLVPVQQPVRTAMPAARLPAVSAPVQERVQAPDGPAKSMTAARSPQPVQPTTGQLQTSSSSNIQKDGHSQPRLVLPDGASITLEVLADIRSRGFPKVHNYPGTVYLIQTKNPADDSIIFSLQDCDIGNIRHLIKEFDDIYPSDQAGIMLRFKIPGGTVLFYGLDFGKSDKMVSFMRAIRELQKHMKQNVQDIAVSAAVSVAASPIPKADGPELSQPVRQADTPRAPKASQRSQRSLASKMSQVAQAPQSLQAPEISTKIESTQTVATLTAKTTEVVTVEDTPVLTATSHSVSHAEPDRLAGAALDASSVEVKAAARNEESPEYIDEILQWVIDTALYMRESSPDEFSIDTIRIIIRAIATSVMSRSSPTFKDLSPKKRANILDEHCCPAVERKFLDWLAREPQLVADMEAKEAQVSSRPQLIVTGDNKEEQVGETKMVTGPALVGKYKANKPEDETQLRAGRQSIVYGTKELLSMRAAAAEGFQHLKGVDIPVDHQRFQREPSHLEAPSVSDQIKKVAEKNVWISSTISGFHPTPSKISAQLEDRGTKTPAPSSCPSPNEIIGICVTNIANTTEDQIRFLLSRTDQAKIVGVIEWGVDNKVVQFGSKEDRDGALEQLSEEYKSGYDPTKPQFKLFKLHEKPDKSEMIGLSVTNAATISDSEIRGFFAAEDRAQVAGVKTLDEAGTKLVQFVSTQHRDYALMRLPEEYKTSRDRSKPLFNIFVPRGD